MSWASLKARAKDWLGDKLVQWVLGDSGLESSPTAPLVDKVEPAPDDAPLLGPEASSMLAGTHRSLDAEPPPPPLEGSAEERLAKLRLR